MVRISASRSRETPRPKRSKSIEEAKALSLVTTGRILSSAALLCCVSSSKRFARLCRRAAAFSVRRLKRLLIVDESDRENMPVLVYLRLVPTLAISQSIAASLAVKSLSEGSFFKISSMGVRPAEMYSVSKSGTPGLLESPWSPSSPNMVRSFAGDAGTNSIVPSSNKLSSATPLRW